MKSRKGFSLVETIVASSIALLLSIVIWGLFTGSVRLFSTSQKHLESMQVAQLVVEMIENDLHSLVLENKDDDSLLSSMKERKSLNFHLCRSGQRVGKLYVAEDVEYSLSQCSGGFCLKRNGKLQEHLPLKRLLFKPIEVPSFDGKPTYYLRTVVTATDSNRKNEFTLVSQVALDRITKARLHSHWRHNDTRYVTF